MKSELCLFYLDNGTSLGGCKEDILHDLEVVLHEGAELGLFLNYQNSEVICDDNDTRAVVLSSLQGAKVVDPINATVLGSSIGGVPSISISLVGWLVVMG